VCFSFLGLWLKELNIASLLACELLNEGCGNVACFHIFVIMEGRLPAWGWPLAISQEERLSYGIGSPWALVGLEISLVLACLSRFASIVSCRLVGKSLPYRFV